jgi:predicted PurR-regulated permease PerM
LVNRQQNVHPNESANLTKKELDLLGLQIVFDRLKMTITSISTLRNLLILFLVFAGLHYAQDFLMPLAIAGVFATLFLPLTMWLEIRKFPRGLAVFICLLVLLLVVGVIGALLGWQISEIIKDIALIKHKGSEVIHQLQQFILDHFGISIEQQSQVLKGQQLYYTDIIQRFAGSVTSILINFVLILAYIFCLLYYRGHIKQFVLKLTAATHRKEMNDVLHTASRVSQQYLVGITKMIMLLWIMYFIGFSIAGVNNVLFFAILCGLLEIIPYIGNITGTTLTVLVAAIQGANPSVLLGIIISYALIQLFQGWILEPIIVGPQVKVNSFTTIIALVIGELVWGIPGIFLAIPLVAMFKIVCDHNQSLKPYGFFIGIVASKKREHEITRKVRSWFKFR